MDAPACGWRIPIWGNRSLAVFFATGETSGKSARLRNGSGWLVAAVLIAALVLLPFATLLYQAFQGSSGLWGHLLSTVLAPALVDTVLLLCGTGLVAALLGTGCAWLVVAYDFPGRKILEWALLLPLAVPTYIVAYAYLDILHPIGPVQEFIRAILGYSGPRQFRLPDVRSLTGCILLLGFVLYPYVYIPVRAMFLTQAGNMIEAARTLGLPRRQIFRRIAIPLARPAIAVGVSLALMETLNDIGASEFLGVRTLTVSIYTTWVTKSDLPGAAQLALVMLLIVVALVAMERAARSRQRYTGAARNNHTMEAIRLGGLRGACAFIAGVMPVVLGFAVPASYLATEAWKRVRFAGFSPRLLDEALNTVSLAALATVLTLICGIAAAYALRVRPGAGTHWAWRLSTTGYAAPGTVVAIGVLICLATLDRYVDALASAIFGISTGLLFIGSGAALVYAYTVRFLAISAGGVEAGFSRIPNSLDHAARTLGRSPGATLFSIHLPLSRASVAAAGLLIFVDCVKELPATLLLRPLNFETFATHLYGEAARGTYEEASIAALAIVVIGIFPAILLARVGRSVNVRRGP